MSCTREERAFWVNCRDAEKRHQRETIRRCLSGSGRHEVQGRHQLREWRPQEAPSPPPRKGPQGSGLHPLNENDKATKLLDHLEQKLLGDPTDVDGHTVSMIVQALKEANVAERIPRLYKRLVDSNPHRRLEQRTPRSLEPRPETVPTSL
ncbi:hypothetical protein L596_012028 [Steinernema carpocapsae]|uniref:Uncharacterized protein n=1 Tax=Steinernema carpocapsae TaxID=34508 RepID=A0A4U5NWP9_STECR|nr:hypothetical protein L596_012028 [Steinernema carpocapsae]